MSTAPPQAAGSFSSLSPLADSTSLCHGGPYLPSPHCLPIQGRAGEAVPTVVRPGLSVTDCGWSQIPLLGGQRSSLRSSDRNM